MLSDREIATVAEMHGSERKIRIFSQYQQWEESRWDLWGHRTPV